LASDTFGFSTPLQLEAWLLRGEVAFLPFSEPWMKLSYGFIYLRNRMIAPAASLYMELVREIEAEQGRRNRELAVRWFPWY